MSISVKESVITPKKSVVRPTDSSAATQPLTQYTRYKVYTQRQLQQIEALQALSPEQRFEMEVVANVLPFRVNEYVINELIDWDKDRKSTRLNSSHVAISYAVFCLKKK